MLLIIVKLLTQCLIVNDSDRDTGNERFFGSRHYCLSLLHCRMA